ncbi:MAG TPA: M1 family metallopeptidase [Candidatus Saccharimonadales bacterium]|nr:M1 family metallopeptidase [Candidatus Saccharimonadales bacterium]
MKSVARLYTQFQPSTYDVHFDIDETAMRFSGTVTIHGRKVGRPSKRLTFHQHGLTITAATIQKVDKKTGTTELTIARLNSHKSYDEIRLHTTEMVYPGEYVVYMEFTAPITTGMTGIYPCFFKEDSAGGEGTGSADKQLIMTQFESHHAREAFPCIDEPEAKAVFNLSLTTRPGITVLGNTPVKEQTTADNGVLMTTFEPTPRMSTYLLAFVMGDMHRKTTTTNKGVEVNVWATTAQPADSMDHALDVAKRSIEFFEEYFGVEYPLAKADHVACPDFSSGAMENWGLVTYRERALLAYPGETAQSTLEQIALVIAHETSHQWFGNLVTMRWWDDLWLNESFANMMEYQAIDSMFPEWHVWDEAIAAEGLSALRRDAVAGVQAVRVEVRHPDEISSLFDPSIVYAKGGRLLYMLKNYIGEDAFRKGLSEYFNIHAYGNTVGSDLWAALGEASGKDIGAFMTPWLTRSGFPLVTVNQEGRTVTLEQEHFLDDPSKAEADRVWPIPLFAGVSGQPDALSTHYQELVLDDDKIMRINTGGRGHYLVRYATAAQRDHIAALVRSQELPEADRLMLLNGSSMQSRAGYEPYGNVLRMLDAYTSETSEPVWGIMSLVVGEARRFIDADPSLEDRIKPFAGKLAASQIARLGWETREDEPAADEKLRALVLGLGAYAEDPGVVAKATELFTAYKDASTPIAPEIRSLAFIVPVKNGDDAAFDFLLKLHDGTQNGDLKTDACDALTATRKPERARQLLARLKDPQLIKPQDVDRWLVYLLRNRYTRDVAWAWLVENWAWLEETFRNDKSYDYLPRYAASCVNTRAYQQKFRDLFESKQDQILLKRNIQLGFEEIETRLQWLERDLASVQEFFK